MVKRKVGEKKEEEEEEEEEKIGEILFNFGRCCSCVNAEL